MSARRVMLICSQHLFGESMEKVLRGADEVELIGPLELNDNVRARIGEIHPNVVVVVDEATGGEESALLTTAVMEQYPKLPVIRANLSENVVRVISTHLLPARGADLLETIRNLPVTPVGKPSDKRSK